MGEWDLIYLNMDLIDLYTDWCFGQNWIIFPYIGNVISPTDELHHFSEGRYTTNQILYDIV